MKTTIIDLQGKEFSIALKSGIILPINKENSISDIRNNVILIKSNRTNYYVNVDDISYVKENYW